MMPPGLAAVDAAKKDKRWEAAYAGPTDMTIPDDFLETLEGNSKAKAFHLSHASSTGKETSDTH
jgi:uncharacterized protein YdeI (YjbR/CyaY-like superfamily)